jgi:hypothetical protein
LLLAATLVPGRTKDSCQNRWRSALDSKSDETIVRVGRWTKEEDSNLKNAVEKHNGEDWAAISALVLGRTNTQCWQRWYDRLHSKAKRTCVTKWSAANIKSSPDEDTPARKKPRLQVQASLPAIVAADADTLNVSKGAGVAVASPDTGGTDPMAASPMQPHVAPVRTIVAPKPKSTRPPELLKPHTVTMDNAEEPRASVSFGPPMLQTYEPSATFAGEEKVAALADDSSPAVQTPQPPSPQITRQRPQCGETTWTMRYIELQLHNATQGDCLVRDTDTTQVKTMTQPKAKSKPNQNRHGSSITEMHSTDSYLQSLLAREPQLRDCIASTDAA